MFLEPLLRAVMCEDGRKIHTVAKFIKYMPWESFWWMLVFFPRMCTCVLQFIALIPVPSLLWIVQSINLALAALTQLIPFPIVCKISHCTAYTLARGPTIDIPDETQRWKRQLEATTPVFCFRYFPHTLNPLPQRFEMQRLWKPMPVCPLMRNPPLIVVLSGPCPISTISLQLIVVCILTGMSCSPLPSRIRKGTPGLFSRWLSVRAQTSASTILEQSIGTEIFLNFTTSCHTDSKNLLVGRRRDLFLKFINWPQTMSRHTSYGMFNHVSFLWYLSFFVAAEERVVSTCPLFCLVGVCCVARGPGAPACAWPSSAFGVFDVFDPPPAAASPIWQIISNNFSSVRVGQALAK